MSQQENAQLYPNQGNIELNREDSLPLLFRLVILAIGITTAIVLYLGPAMVQTGYSNNTPYRLVEYWWSNQNLNEPYGYPSDAVAIFKIFFTPYLIFLVLTLLPFSHNKFFLNLSLFTSSWLLLTSALRIFDGWYLLIRGYEDFLPTNIAYSVLLLLMLQTVVLLYGNYRYFPNYFRLTVIPVIGNGVLLIFAPLHGLSYSSFGMYGSSFFRFHEVVVILSMLLFNRWKVSITPTLYDYRRWYTVLAGLGVIFPLFTQLALLSQHPIML